MITTSSNLSVVYNEDNQINLKLTQKFMDFNFAIKYTKGDETGVLFKFKVKPYYSTNYFYVTKTDRELTKLEYQLLASDSTLIYIDKLPEYEELIIEVYYEGTPTTQGDLELLVFTRRY